MELKVLHVDRSSRPSASWASEIEKEKSAFASLVAHTGVTEAISETWVAEFVRSEFALEGMPAEGIGFSALRNAPSHFGEEPVAAHLALRIATAIRSIIAVQGRPASGDSEAEFLALLYRLLAGAGSNGEEEPLFRVEPGAALFAGHEPAPASIVPPLLRAATDWMEEPSFRELHPVERAVLMHARIADLQPFSAYNGTVSRLAASSITIREGYPPLIFAESEKDRYRDALARALLMQTQPCVELFAEALGRQCRLAIERMR